MTAAAFDTLAYARRLRDAGIDGQVAEAQAAALAEVLQQNVDTLATKRDLEALELRLESRIETIKSDLLKWVIGLLLAQIAIIAALVKLF